jgi:hypothetical protein
MELPGNYRNFPELPGTIRAHTIYRETRQRITSENNVREQRQRIPRKRANHPVFIRQNHSMELLGTSGNFRELPP